MAIDVKRAGMGWGLARSRRSDVRRWAVAVLVLTACAVVAFRDARAEPASRGPMAQVVYTPESGLPAGTVKGLAQTRDGYLWINTDNVFVRFDGIRFSAKESISVDALGVDEAGALWALGTGGSVLTRRGANPRSFNLGRSASTTAINPVLAFGARGRIYVQGDHSSPLLFVDGESVRPFVLPDGTPVVSALGVAASADGSEWIAARHEVLHMADGRATPVSLQACGEAELQRFSLGRSGRVWLGMKDGAVCSPEGPSGQLVRITKDQGLRGTELLALHEDAEGALWIGTQAGLFRWDGSLHEQELHVAGERMVQSLFEDREGTIWVGLVPGLVSLRRGPAMTWSAESGLWSGAVRTLALDGAAVLVGGQHGEIARIERDHVTLLRPASDDGVPVSALLRLSGGDIVAGDRNGVGKVGVSAAFDPMIGKFSGVRVVEQSPSGALWVATKAGLFRVGEGATTAVSLGAIDLERNVFSIAFSGDGSVWVATYLNRHAGLFRSAPGQPFQSVDVPEELAPYRWMPLRFDRRGVLWVGTNGAGILRYSDRRFTKIDARRGLFDDCVWEVVEDDASRLWMSSDNGLWWVARDELDRVADGLAQRVTSMSYGIADGLRAREFNGGTTRAGVRTPDGRLWWATIGGVAVVDPAQIGRNSGSLRAHVESLVVDGQPVESLTPRIRPGGEHFAIAYTAPTSIRAADVRFRYRLDGFDRGWVEADTRRTAYYTGLAPGDYTFRVVAMNGEGDTDETAATLSFAVLPFFWQTGVFRALVVVAFAGAVLLFVRLRVARLRGRQRELEAIVEDRTRDLVAEKSKSERLLHNMLPEAIAQRLKANTSAIAERHEEVTVLFADLVGFTELSSRTTPEDLVAMLNDVFSRFDSLAHELGAEKIKTIGDAYLVAAGCPAPSKDHADVMVRMAFGMLDVIEAVNRERGTRLDIRIGLHSGAVVAGVIGTSKYTYDLWGDTVNTASRMESHGAAGRIHLSAATRAHLGIGFELEARGPIAVKGKGTMETFWLLRPDVGATELEGSVGSLGS
jgi:class 3 adenylate cyclase/ligand-binding sensor domain-containing protein